jgi:hypothetical protein
VELARGIWEHLQDVGLPICLGLGELRVGNDEGLLSLPDLLPLPLDCLGVVPLHFSSSGTKKPLLREASGTF